MQLSFQIFQWLRISCSFQTKDFDPRNFRGQTHTYQKFRLLTLTLLSIIDYVPNNIKLKDSLGNQFYNSFHSPRMFKMRLLQVQLGTRPERSNSGRPNRKWHDEPLPEHVDAETKIFELLDQTDHSFV